MVGVGKAAEYGIWIRNGKALQRMGQPGSIVLDKTGTLRRISITAVIRYATAFYPWVCYNERLEVLQRLGQSMASLMKASLSLTHILCSAT